MIRMWINQPSKLQPLHEYHGVNVLAEQNKEFPTVYLTEGNIVSMVIHRLALSSGWITNEVR